MTTWRMLPPINVAKQTMTGTVNTRSYSGVPGQAFDIVDTDAKVLNANGWIAVGTSGPTSARPTGSTGLYPAIAGERFFDTTLGVEVFYDGATWRSASGAAV